MPRSSSILSVALMLLLTACASSSALVDEPNISPSLSPTTPPATTKPIEMPSPTLAELPTPTSISFDWAVYRDEVSGFELQYPSSWTLPEGGELGSRGSIKQLSEEGEPRLDIVVLQWDPKNDLNAFVDARKQAWSASGFTLLSEEQITLQDGHPAASFEIDTLEGDQAFFFFTSLGDRYLQLSGSGDMALLPQVSRTVRQLTSDGQLDLSPSEPCLATETEPLDWITCNLIDGIRSRNLSALHGYMADPFVLGYWASEFRSVSPQEATSELAEYRLPADPASPMTFTTDRSKFPSLAGVQLETLFGPDVKIARVVYSEGWGQDGNGAALLFIAQIDSGEFYWQGLVYSDGHFDK